MMKPASNPVTGTVSGSVVRPMARVWLACWLLIVIVAGLASRRYPVFPAALEQYPGDALWAVAVLLALAIVRPQAAPWRVAGAALLISWLVELSQLYQAPWINAVRNTTIGHLFLGAGFSSGDLLAYAIGIGLAFVPLAVLLGSLSGRRVSAA